MNPDARQGLPTVAILLSTFNGETFLEAQLDSLAAQESVAVEVFVRDDGSTDGTLAVLAKYARRWPALAAPFAGANLGPAASFLELLRNTPLDYDYYAFCDQDDVWLPDKLLRAATRLSSVPAGKPALYCSRVICVDEKLRPLGKKDLGGDGRFEHLVFENIAFGNTVVMNATAATLVRECSPGPFMIMHDWWCALVVSAFGVVIYDERPGVLYRQHDGNAIGASPARWRELLALLRLFLRDPRRFYPVHVQVAEFLRLYGDRLAPKKRRLAESLVKSRESFSSRIRYAFSGEIVRSDLWGAIAVRVLVIVGWY